MSRQVICVCVLALLLISAGRAAPASPTVAWTDQRHALLTWQQATPAELCISKVAHQNYILIGCGPFDAGPQELQLPPFPSGNDAEVWPAAGDVYIVGGRWSAALGPPPELRFVWLPIVRR